MTKRRNRHARRKPQPNQVHAALMQTFAGLDGVRIPGGCQHCDAYQVPQVLDQGLVQLTVRHDAWCQRLRAITKGATS
jgi:hypothetical protein